MTKVFSILSKSVLFIGLLLAVNAPLAKAQQFKFAVITDLHVNANTISESRTLYHLFQSVNDINLQNVDFTVINGDITDFGYTSYFKAAKHEIDQLEKPVYVLPGNHDTKWSETAGAGFKNVFGDNKFVFEHQGIKFIGFQTAVILRRGKGHIAPEDLRWLKETLEATSKTQPLIVFTHYPLIERETSNWYEVTDLLRQYNTQVIIVGHGHRNQRMEFDGIPGIMTQDNKTSPNYTIVEVTPNLIQFFNKNIQTDSTKFLFSTWFETKDYSKVYPGKRPDFSVNKEYATGRTLWKIENDFGFFSAAAYDNGKIFIGDYNGTMHCLSKRKGEELWSFKTQGPIMGEPCVAKGKVVFGSVDSVLYCLDASDGKVVWKRKTFGPILSPVAIDKGIVYSGSCDGTYVALELSTGEIKWEFEGFAGYIETAPVIERDTMVFTTWDFYLYAATKKNGNYIWKWNVPNITASPAKINYYAPGGATPVVTKGRAFLASPDQVLNCIDLKTGKTIWATNNSDVRYTEAIGISAKKDLVFVKQTKDIIAAYSTGFSEPKLVWQTDFKFGSDENNANFTTKGNTIYFTTNYGFIGSANAKNGKVLWKQKIGNSLINPVTVVGNNRILVTTVDGTIALVKTKGLF